ncbi:DUF4860 domain-containing protein [Sedimentibacter sp. MB31-C6]|uniref:DUF4860 domain-containing protein n=1 Tax=Sedimentibacter sp. MB31-C6 TaxID=3109366 RepID=UPI002DDD8E53|nr:DUF4860 domain-containing protein [Sedimentibacter sp. MB36-C1]WSI04922.1 DUF4860 domain-containing protein [Sedimentibacter sp. MB36-C1]
MKKNSTNQFSIHFIFVMLLFLTIVILSVMIIILGSDIYTNIKDERDSNYEIRVSLSYISNKLRQADNSKSINIKTIHETPAIVINETYDSLNYETWIYYYDGYLYEIFIDEGTEFSLSDGMKVLKIDNFSIYKKNGNLYEFSINSGDYSSELVLSLNSNQLGGVSIEK